MTSNLVDTNKDFIAKEIRYYVDFHSNKFVEHYLKLGLSKSSAERYARTCAFWEFVREKWSQINPGKRISRRSFVLNVLTAGEQLDLAIPKNERVFKQKLEQIISGVDVKEVVKVRNLGNKNASKINDEQRIKILQLWARENNPSIAEVYRKVVELGKLKGWWVENDVYDPPSYTEIYRLVSKHRNALSYVRYGSAYVENVILPQINRQKLDKKNMVWGIDGTSYNVFVIVGNKVYQRIYVVMVIDYTTKKLLGIATKLYKGERNGESFSLVKEALQDAILRSGYKPMILNFDKGPASRELAKYCKEIGIKPYISGVGRARAKDIESFFNQFDDVWTRYQPAWSGKNRTAQGQNSQPSVDAVANIKHRARDIGTEIRDLKTKARDVWNNHRFVTGENAGKSPNELWEMYESATPRLSGHELALDFGYKHEVNLTSEGAVIHKNGMKYIYVPDDWAEIYKQIPVTNGLRRLTVYVLEYGQPAYVYYEGKYLGLWRIKQLVNKIGKFTGDEGYKQAIEEQRKVRETLKEQLSEIMEEVDETVEELASRSSLVETNPLDKTNFNNTEIAEKEAMVNTEFDDQNEDIDIDKMLEQWLG